MVGWIIAKLLEKMGEKFRWDLPVLQ